jgi:DNA invertase Pin-like site-specific DNA recombinase
MSLKRKRGLLAAAEEDYLVQVVCNRINPIRPLSGRDRRHAVIYSRIAADPQSTDFDALEMQEWWSEEACRLHNFTAIEKIREVASGTQLVGRKGLDRLREMLRARQVDVVVVVSEDRLSRNSAALRQLVEEIRGAGAFICISHGV